METTAHPSPHAFNRRIFESDPLLLKDENQVDYGRAILRHLLINRTVTSCIPLPINLHRRNSKDFFLQRRPKPPSPPTVALVDQVRRDFLDRKAYEDMPYLNDVRKLTMVSDGALTNRRDAKHYFSHADAAGELERLRKQSTMNARFKSRQLVIAFASANWRTSRLVTKYSGRCRKSPIRL